MQEPAKNNRESLLLGIIQLLKKDLNVSLELTSNGRSLIKLGDAAPEKTTSYTILDHELIVGKALEDITPDEALSITSARKLAEILVPRIQTGSIKTSVLLEIFLEILRTLSERTKFLNHYEKIIHLNEQILLANDLATVLQIVMDVARDAISGSGASLLLVDSRTGELYFNVVSGEKGVELREIRIPAGRGIAGSVVQNARAEIIRDVATDPRQFRQVDQALGQVTKDMIVAPIIARGQVTGVIEVVNSRSSAGFLSEDLEFLTNIAANTSLLIENARNLQELLKTNRELDRKISEINALYEIGRVLNSSLDPIELKKGLLRSLLKLLRIGSGSILVPDESRRNLRMEFALSISPDGIDEITESLELNSATDILLWLRNNREPFYFDNPQLENEGLANRFKRDNPPMFSSHPPDVWVPVLAGGGEEISFIISLGETNMRRRDPVSDIAFFRSVMNQAYSAFQNVESYRSAVIAREKEQQIRGVFQKYVPLRIVQEALSQSENPRPRSQPVSVMFADIRDFTTLAETTEAGLLFELLNEFFEEMVGIVNARNGVVDKFMGDCVMAVFGMPDTTPTDAANALSTAREMVMMAKILNEKRVSENRPAFHLSIGLNTGPAIVGIVGSKDRQDYTAIGDSVNIASRLEKLAKFYNSEVLFTEETLTQAGGSFPCREIDLIQVRGRTGLTRIFQLIHDESIWAKFEPLNSFWQTALEEYRSGSFESAMSGFERFRNAVGGDPVADIFIERCKTYIQSPPAPGFQGIFRLDV